MREFKRHLEPKSTGPREVLHFLREDGGGELLFSNEGKGGYAATVIVLWNEQRKYGSVLRVDRAESGITLDCALFGPGADRAAGRVERVLKRLR